MKRFIKNIFIFSFCFFVLDKLFYPLLILSPKLEVDQRLEQIITGDLNKDIIIIGSSRGARNIIAKQIEDSLHRSCYNLSYPGSDVTFHEFILKSVLEFNESPELVLLAIDDPGEFEEISSINFRSERLYPLLKYNYINNELIARGEKNLFSKIFILSRINRSNFNLKKQNYTPLDTILSCGSMPISFQRENREWLFNEKTDSYHIENEIPEKKDAFLSIQEMCVNNNINLVLIFPPNFKSHNTSFENRIRKLSNTQTSFIVYDTLNPIYLDKSKFYDESHLLQDGAIEFTEELIEQLP